MILHILLFPIFLCVQLTCSENNILRDEIISEVASAPPFKSPSHYPTVMPTSCQVLPTTELEALHDIYDSTNGQFWDYSVAHAENGIPWNFSQPDPNPCAQSWAFITCHRCYVEQLLMVSANLNGTLPSTISELSYLTASIYFFNYTTIHDLIAIAS